MMDAGEGGESPLPPQPFGLLDLPERNDMDRKTNEILMRVVEDEARRDPVVAYWLLRGPKKPYSKKVTFTFTTGEPDKPLDDNVQIRSGCVLLVTDMPYTVRRPAYLPEDPLKPFYDAELIKNPYIDVEMWIDACVRRSITDKYQAAETVLRPASNPGSSCCAPFILQQNATFYMRTMLKRQYPEAQLPIVFEMTLVGMVADCQVFGALGPEMGLPQVGVREACDYLCQQGIKIEDDLRDHLIDQRRFRDE